MKETEKIIRLKEWLAVPQRITIVSHTNPDGDAIGSGLAWLRTLESLGHTVRFIVPNPYPYFLGWMRDIGRVHVYKTAPEENAAFIADSGLIFCLDFNQLHRLEALGEAVLANASAKKILIDHHLAPPDEYDLSFSDTKASSTSYLVYEIIRATGLQAALDYATAESLYVGISTDTGNFTYGNLTPELFRAVAGLVELGLDVPRLNIAIYNNFSADRMRLLGYMLDEKMVLLEGCRAAYMTLTLEEQTRYNFRQGDSEGFVNMPLSIRDVRISAFFIQTTDCIKVSLRSQGDADVNALARACYNGGGHKNAAGGKFFGSMHKAVELFKEAVRPETEPE